MIGRRRGWDEWWNEGNYLIEPADEPGDAFGLELGA